VEHKTYSCKGDMNCVINPRTRNACRYCRYLRCLSVGMSRDGESSISSQLVSACGGRVVILFASSVLYGDVDRALSYQSLSPSVSSLRTNRRRCLPMSVR